VGVGGWARSEALWAAWRRCSLLTDRLRVCKLVARALPISAQYCASARPLQRHFNRLLARQPRPMASSTRSRLFPGRA
jgi:hypothetical protein